jgi:hypothetical protein
LLLSLFIFFFFIWCRFSVVICEVDLIGELDTEGATLDPGGFGFQRDGLGCELFEDRVVYTGDHIRRFDEGEGKAGFHVQSGCLLTWERELEKGETIAETRLLGEDLEGNTLFLIEET